MKITLPIPDTAIPVLEMYARAAGCDLNEYLIKLIDREINKERSAEIPGEVSHDPEAWVTHFRQYQGMLAGVTLQDIIESRHEGLAG